MFFTENENYKTYFTIWIINMQTNEFNRHLEIIKIKR
jgi:hypothetical protein